MKLDNLQPSGSFKIRGIGQTCLQAKQSGATTIVGSSGGNAGKAMAYAAKKLGLKAVLFIPTSTPQMMIEKIKVSNRNHIRMKHYGVLSFPRMKRWYYSNTLHNI